MCDTLLERGDINVCSLQIGNQQAAEAAIIPNVQFGEQRSLSELLREVSERGTSAGAGVD